MNLNKRGHGMTFPIWAIWLLYAWMTISEPYYEIVKLTNKPVAIATYIFLFTLQGWLVYKYGWKTLIPILTYLIWWVWRLP